MTKHLTFAEITEYQNKLGLGEARDLSTGQPTTLLPGLDAGWMVIPLRHTNGTEVSKTEAENIAKSLELPSSHVIAGQYDSDTNRPYVVAINTDGLTSEQIATAKEKLKTNLALNNAEAGQPVGNSTPHYLNNPGTEVGDLERNLRTPMISKGNNQAEIAIPLSEARADAIRGHIEGLYNSKTYVGDWFHDAAQHNFDGNGKAKVNINYVDMWKKYDQADLVKLGKNINAEIIRDGESRANAPSANNNLNELQEKLGVKFEYKNGKYIATLPDEESAGKLKSTLDTLADGSGYWTERRWRTEQGMLIGLTTDSDWIDAKNLSKVNGKTVELDPHYVAADTLHWGHIKGIGYGYKNPSNPTAEGQKAIDAFAAALNTNTSTAAANRAAPHLELLNHSFALRADNENLAKEKFTWAQDKDASGKLIYTAAEQVSFTQKDADEKVARYNAAFPEKADLMHVIKKGTEFHLAIAPATADAATASLTIANTQIEEATKAKAEAAKQDAATKLADTTLLNNSFALRKETVGETGSWSSRQDATDPTVTLYTTGKAYADEKTALVEVEKYNTALALTGDNAFKSVKLADNQFIVAITSTAFDSSTAAIKTANQGIKKMAQQAAEDEAKAKADEAKKAELLTLANSSPTVFGAAKWEQVAAQGNVNERYTTAFPTEAEAIAAAKQYNEKLKLAPAEQFSTETVDGKFLVVTTKDKLAVIQPKIVEANNAAATPAPAQAQPGTPAEQAAQPAADPSAADFAKLNDKANAAGTWSVAKGADDKPIYVTDKPYATLDEAKAAAEKLNGELGLKPETGLFAAKTKDGFVVASDSSRVGASFAGTVADVGGHASTPSGNQQTAGGNMIDDNKFGMMAGIGGMLLMMFMGFDPLIAILGALVMAVAGSALGDGGKGFMGSMFPGLVGNSQEQGKANAITLHIEGPNGQAVAPKGPDGKDMKPGLLFNKEGQIVTDLSQAAYAVEGRTEVVGNDRKFVFTKYQEVKDGKLGDSKDIPADTKIEQQLIPVKNGDFMEYIIPTNTPMKAVADTLAQVSAKTQTPAKTPAQILAGKDKNQDGYLSRDELDADKNGQIDSLSVDEKAAFAAILKDAKNKVADKELDPNNIDLGALPKQNVGTPQETQGVYIGKL